MMTPERRQRVIDRLRRGMNPAVGAKPGELAAERASDAEFNKACQKADNDFVRERSKPIVRRARKGNIEAQAALDELGIPWRPVVRFNIIDTNHPDHPNNKKG